MRSRIAFVWLAVSLAGVVASAQSPTANGAGWVPALAPLPRASASELRDAVERFSADWRALQRRYDTDYSTERRSAIRAFTAAWLARLDSTDFSSLGTDARVDWILLRARLAHERQLLAREEQRLAEVAALVPFDDTILSLEDARRRLVTVDPAGAARTLAWLTADVSRVRAAVEAGVKGDTARSALKSTKLVAYHAADVLGSLRRTLSGWFKFSDGYDPLFSWWVTKPYQQADSALGRYIRVLREHVVGVKPGDDEPIVGQPIGRTALLEDLSHEVIAYSPEELLTIAQREFAWCEAEMKKAAREMGLGDDWRAALERVKQDHVAPGAQPALVRDLEREAERYIVEHDLVTVPPLAHDLWRMEMLSPERQKESPFFLGGETILVSYPTDAMDQADKLMSMRGNNAHFSRATVFHELIPGHELQGFMTERYNPQRRAFSTPFWIEGNAFYWETLLWDLGFPRGPEDRIGMLFWRMHRAARIIFSLNFHLGNWTPQQCIDFLVDRVGHERANATAEVRRSFNGDYSPLYQVAYMIGGLQFRALHHELVDAGTMTNRQFHDAILQNGSIPVELVRALLLRRPPARDFRPTWRFAEPGAAAPSRAY
jgi:uncharacterized protein (DUF885 family)